MKWRLEIYPLAVSSFGNQYLETLVLPTCHFTSLNLTLQDSLLGGPRGFFNFEESSSAMENLELFPWVGHGKYLQPVQF